MCRIFPDHSTFCVAELFKQLHHTVSVKLEMDSDSSRHVLQRREPGGLKHIEIRWLAISSGSETSVLDAWIRRTTQRTSSQSIWKDDGCCYFPKSWDNARQVRQARMRSQSSAHRRAGV